MQKLSYLPSEGIRHCKRRRDPTECVHNMGRQPTDNALDRASDQLRGRYDHRARQQQHRREDVVQPEHRIVCPDRLVLEVHAQTS